MATTYHGLVPSSCESVSRLELTPISQVYSRQSIHDSDSSSVHHLRGIVGATSPWDTYEEKNVQIHIFGNAAVLTGSMNLKGTGAKPSGRTWVESPETTFAGTVRFTRVWVNQNGGWRLAALQNALVKVGDKS
jgi:hypothetical protein